MDLLINPPKEKEFGYEIPEFFDPELNDALVVCGKVCTHTLFKKIDLLDLKPIRSNTGYVLGGIGAQKGLPYLTLSWKIMTYLKMIFLE